MMGSMGDGRQPRIRGSLTLEAALVLPLLVFTLASILYLAKVVHIMDYTQHILNMGAMEGNNHAVVLRAAGAQLLAQMEQTDPEIQGSSPDPSLREMLPDELLFAPYFHKEADGRALEEWGVAGSISFAGTEILGEDGWSTVRLSYAIPLPVEIFGRDSIAVRQAVRIRGFIGNRPTKDLLEKEAPKTVVHVTGTGVRYHTDSRCRHIHVEFYGVSSDTVAGNKRPCKICGGVGPEEGPKTVYTTAKSEIYHADGKCTALVKSVRETTLEKALEDGYTLCKTCEGED
ncbi:TadE family protein [Anaerotalea alkaliphila]|uniref:Pilus assembly protein n=1 Tax=Anaerotalea alkaliphila TaxID=2662126 RepID=A0A7X5HXJ1_9FIRM|nr:TadE family protein [Anaerotalea alkaliphila]NDL68436.1 pilus assembly protein [Anaerotalea alkaliphila]